MPHRNHCNMLLSPRKQSSRKRHPLIERRAVCIGDKTGREQRTSLFNEMMDGVAKRRAARSGVIDWFRNGAAFAMSALRRGFFKSQRRAAQ